MRARAGLVWKGLDGETTDGLVRNSASGSLSGVPKSLLYSSWSWNDGDVVKDDD
jgi:hypothetical protein